MVGIGGLEPPTSSLSEMRSNQLSYMPLNFLWCREAELNHRHKAFQASALPLSYPGMTVFVAKKYLRGLFYNKMNVNFKKKFYFFEFYCRIKNIVKLRQRKHYSKCWQLVLLAEIFLVDIL